MPRLGNSAILVVSGVSFLFAFMMAIRVMHKPAPAADLPKNTALQVVTAVKDIQGGSPIQKEDVALSDAPSDVNPKVLFTDFEKVVGKISRRSILKGEPVKNIDLFEAGDNLASLIPQGYRAMTVPVTIPPELLSLVRIGNRVDILLTYEVSRGIIQSATLMENVKVIGVSDKASGYQGQFFVTLALTPTGVETLAYAQRKGVLNLSVRSLYQADESEEKFYSLKQLFFKDNPIPQAPVATKTIEIIRGVKTEKYKIAQLQDEISKVTAPEGQS